MLPWCGSPEARSRWGFLHILRPGRRPPKLNSLALRRCSGHPSKSPHAFRAASPRLRSGCPEPGRRASGRRAVQPERALVISSLIRAFSLVSFVSFVSLVFLIQRRTVMAYTFHELKGKTIQELRDIAKGVENQE